MPIYEYECDSCSFRFEKKQGFDDGPETTCPECRGLARRLFHPAPIIFKGSGFYVTDNRKGSDTEFERGKDELPVKKEPKGK